VRSPETVIMTRAVPRSKACHAAAGCHAKGAALGRAMLFSAAPPDQDFVYAAQLEAFANERLVDLNVAFSRVGETISAPYCAVFAPIDELFRERAGEKPTNLSFASTTASGRLPHAA
jgi:hypothetical protein